ncbi:Kelch repeat:Kelch precursor [Minicystis rosea]|nr:Kelch repeat:Kelch precursor [Minicystis rosea]
MIAPALLLLLAQGCSPSAAPRDAEGALALAFPRHAQAVIQRGTGFELRDGTRFVPRARSRFGFAAGADVELPIAAGEPLVLRGASGFEARVREVGAAGPGRLVDRAVAYAREGGASFWSTVSGGVEEWVHLDAGRTSADKPALTWTIEGAEARQSGDLVELADADGVVQLQVTAPVAYAASGRRVPVRLTAAGVSSIELFVDANGEAVLIDPLWLTAASLLAPRYGHKDAVLGDGTILVAGGTSGGPANVSPSTMIYHPGADVWTGTMPLNSPRMCHTATDLGDGSALVAGGVDPLGYLISDVEVYDPIAATWAFVPNLNYTHLNHGATRLLDGTILVTGGRSDDAVGGSGQPASNQGLLEAGNDGDCWRFPKGFTTSATERFDPNAIGNGWQLAASMAHARERHTVTRLADGHVLAAGGEENGFIHDSTEIYDPVGDAWSFGGWMSSQREDHTATLLDDGTVLIAGGTDGSGAPTSTADIFIYDPNGGGGSGSGGSGSLYMTGSMSTPRAQHTASLLPDGTVLVAGGTDGFSSLATAEIFDPQTGLWTDVPSMTTPRAVHTATTLASGAVLVTGGMNELGDAVTGAELYYWASPLGSACEGGSMCQSGYCVDDVCCDSECSATACLACTATLKGGGQDGVCGPAAAGTNPHQDCADEGMDSCGQTGVCNGMGACALYAPGTTCSEPYCQGNTAYAAAACDGSGSCNPPTAVPCDPGLCANGQCKTSCIDDGDCAASAYCNAGTCAPKKPTGQPSTAPNACQSGFATDGVCCDAACTGSCVACSAAKKGSGVDGACGPIKVGTDPDSECANQGSSSCGTDGTCDGAGACAFYAAGTVCATGTCVGSTAIQPSLCDGSGSCVPGSATSCDPAGCSGGACLTGCTTDPQCGGSAYCNAGTCAPQKALGQPATTANQCLSGAVADGVCCNVPCTGACVACTALLKGGGADGVCGPIKVGTDPDNECPNQGTASCGTNGMCDGAGACALYPSGTVCAGASCQGSKLVQASLCDGSGSCQPQGSVTCSPGVCAGGTCQGGCVLDSDCASTAFCNAGSCAPKKPTGQGATTPNQCLSGHVADGVCCDVSCVGTCVACTAAKKGSGADGQCGAVQSGTDPDQECTDQGAASCGPSGSCSGSGSCALYPAGTLCVPASCQGNTAIQPSLCDGSGYCIDGGAVDCAPSTCGGGTCVSSCAGDDDCIATAYCNAGTCAPKKALGQGATAPNECLTGFVADGICCDTACTGTCAACTAAKKGAGSDGTCGAILAGADPDDECVATSAESCGTTGSCDGAGACALHPAGTVCVPGSCEGNTMVQPDLCDGNGVCVVSGTVDCSPAQCVGSACENACKVDEDCKSATSYCTGNTCQPKKPAGQPAKGSNECLSGFVADSVCCSTACQSGPCDACSVAAGAIKDGECASLNGAACDDGDACTQVDVCVGAMCTGTMPVSCPAPDQCHEAGACDSTSGACTDVPKPSGAACDDGNPCTVDACQKGACLGVSVLDNTPCPGGVCIAGTCLLDPNAATTASSSATGSGGTTTSTSASSSGAGGSPGTGGAPGTGGQGGEDEKAPHFTGGGCLSISPAEAPAGHGMAALFAALVAALRKRNTRRARGSSGRAS